MQIIYHYGKSNNEVKPRYSLNQTEFIFPVVGGFETEVGFEMQQLVGTAFYIKNGLYVTAAHVINTILSTYKDIALGALNLEQGISRYIIEGYECYDDQDIAIIKSVKSEENSCLRWTARAISPGAEVITFGYPFGMDVKRDKANIVHRVIKGCVTAHGKFTRFGEIMCYELSFPCMAGLSGSFLIDEKEYLIRGIIRGSSDHYIESGEYQEDDGSKSVIWKETMKLGLATSAENFMNIKSELLGCTLKEYLAANDLLR